MATFLTDTDFRLPSSGGTLDLDALVELSNRRRRTMEEARANVERRRQDLRDQGMLGYEDVADQSAAADKIQDNILLRTPKLNSGDLMESFFPEYKKDTRKWQESNYANELMPDLDEARRRDMPNIQAKKLPGIGTAVRSSDGKVAVSGRYGVGFAQPRDTPDPNRKIEGIPAAEWFAKKAAEQGESNRFATAAPTGKTDEWGRPTYTGKAVVQSAMQRKKA